MHQSLRSAHVKANRWKWSVGSFRSRVSAKLAPLVPPLCAYVTFSQGDTQPIPEVSMRHYVAISLMTIHISYIYHAKYALI
jgi:hypothetical protein